MFLVQSSEDEVLEQFTELGVSRQSRSRRASSAHPSPFSSKGSCRRSSTHNGSPKSGTDQDHHHHLKEQLSLLCVSGPSSRASSREASPTSTQGSSRGSNTHNGLPKSGTDQDYHHHLEEKLSLLCVSGPSSRASSRGSSAHHSPTSSKESSRRTSCYSLLKTGSAGTTPPKESHFRKQLCISGPSSRRGSRDSSPFHGSSRRTSCNRTGSVEFKWQFLKNFNSWESYQVTYNDLSILVFRCDHARSASAALIKVSI
jgi:hypothetical protein